MVAKRPRTPADPDRVKNIAARTRFVRGPARDISPFCLLLTVEGHPVVERGMKYVAPGAAKTKVPAVINENATVMMSPRGHSLNSDQKPDL